MSETRLLIVDDSAETRACLRSIAEANHLRVVAEAEDGSQALNMIPDLEVDVVLLDVTMPVMGGFETARKLRQLAPDLLIIFVTQHREATYVNEAFRAGALGYLLKSAAATELNQAVETVSRRQIYRSSRLLSEVAGQG